MDFKYWIEYRHKTEFIFFKSVYYNIFDYKLWIIKKKWIFLQEISIQEQIPIK